MTTDLSADLALAHALADAARSVTMPRFRGKFTSRNKADGSLVTEVDEAAEDAIRAIVARERPRDAFLGEERGETGSGPRRWIVDAIDGTSSFAEGTAGWGTLIALEIDGRVAVGVCEMSPIDKRYWATSGGGAYVSRSGVPSERLEVSGTAEFGAARCFVPPPLWVRTDAARAMSSALRAATLPYEPDEHPALEIATGRADLACSSWPAHGISRPRRSSSKRRAAVSRTSRVAARWGPAPYFRTAGCTMRLSICCMRAGSVSRTAAALMTLNGLQSISWTSCR